MKEYLLTICIPTYNRSVLLKGLIINVLTEIEKSGCAEDIQILIVDGKSGDNTQEIVKELNADGKIKYYRREKKEGIDKDILKCIEDADGEYCWLFSDDDRFAPGSVSYLVNVLKREKNLTGCFCNRISYDFQLENKVAEAKWWPGELIKENRIFTDKAECFKYIGMDFGFISSQVVKRSVWQEVVKTVDFADLYNSYYLMVHIIARMMDKEFKWLYINEPLVKQRTGNDSLLKSTGIMERQMIEQNSFHNIIIRHYDRESKEYKIFFKKMVNRLPRVIANLKSQDIDYKTQIRLFKLYYDKYSNYSQFWIKLVPVFFLPNVFLILLRKVYFKYCV